MSKKGAEVNVLCEGWLLKQSGDKKKRMPHGRVELEKGVEQPEHCDLWTLLVFLFVIVWL